MAQSQLISCESAQKYVIQYYETANSNINTLFGVLY